MPQLVEQPSVFDGNDGLGSEILHQRDLFVGKRPHFLAIDGDGSDHFAFFEHWHAN